MFVAAIQFPDIDPYVFPPIPAFELFGAEIGPLGLRWYALAYIAGLVLGWLMIRHLMRRGRLFPGGEAPMAPEKTDDLLFVMTLGVVLGGRLGFTLFYSPELIWENPMQILRIWEGGMAFHGGMLGVILGVIWFSRANNVPLLSLGDAVAVVTPIGLLFGRIANFINAELWGRVTDQPWGVVFPTVEGVAQSLLRSEDRGYQLFGQELLATVGQPRHPSQLYEGALEGALLLGVLAWLAYRTSALKCPGFCTGVFLIGYGLARGTVEFWRQPDILKNTEFLGMEITRGQLLSLPMIFAGAAFVYYAQSRARAAAA